MARILIEVDAERWAELERALVELHEADGPAEARGASEAALAAQDRASAALALAAEEVLAEAKVPPPAPPRSLPVAGVVMAGRLVTIGDLRDDPELKRPQLPSCGAVIDDVVIPATREQCRALGPYLGRRVGLVIEVHPQEAP